MIGNHVNELSHVNDANPSTVSLASLALFKLARILSRVLQENYSILGPHCETTLESTPIAEELSSWLSDFTAEFSCDGVMGDGANKTFLTMVNLSTLQVDYLVNSSSIRCITIPSHCYIALS